MKILITGANSYIGINVENWLKEHGDFTVDSMNMHGDKWKEADFGQYDAIFHVAGIAHVDIGNASEATKQQYYKVNCDMAYECAEKAKREGVKQFIFTSSMSVYPGAKEYGTKNMITADTSLGPDNFYGESKLRAEMKLNELRDKNFKIVIIRSPMIYGKGAKGNYRTLKKLACKLPLFPKIDNERSMLYIENLCEFVRLMLVNEEDGLFFPQNDVYTNTTEMSREIAKAHGKKLRVTKLFTPMIRAISHTKGKYGTLVCKAFGSLTYDMSLSDYKENYRVCDWVESIRRTEAE